MTELKNQLVSTAQSASFSGENWLYNDIGRLLSAPRKWSARSPVTLPARFRRRPGIRRFDLGSDRYQRRLARPADQGHLSRPAVLARRPDANATYFLVVPARRYGCIGYAKSHLTASTTDDDIEGMISAVDAMLTSLTDAAATLGATNTRISMQDDFMADLMDVIDKGVGRLVDADMNEESTRLKALQTQQQLGIQALSIANSNSQNILSLFR